jgi:hypothetical protein
VEVASRRWLAAVLLIPLVPASCLAAKNKKRPAPYALVSGTVFRESGLSFPGAEVEIEAARAQQGRHKFKKMQAVSDARGEFAFRVPVDDMEYRLTAKAAGCQTQVKTVQVSGEVRVDVFFTLPVTSGKAPASQ